jgi:beta-glucosidase
VVKEDFYGGTPPFTITPLAGIRAQSGAKFDVRYSADPAKAQELARSSDVAVLVLGSDPTCGATFGKCPDPTEGKEAVDRHDIALNAGQEALIEQTYAANPRTILVLVTGYPYAINWAQEHVPGIVTISHSSEEQGAALAEVLFGDYNPSGHLTVTWPASLNQLPPMMDYNLRDGRTYLYSTKKPLYAFGHGLSYTAFRYDDMRVSSSRLRANGTVTVSVMVRNIGSRDGDDVVQLYVRHMGSAISRPLRELKGFRRVHVAHGAATQVQFRLAAKDLAYWNAASHSWSVEADRVELELGSASDDIEASRTITVLADGKN